MPLTPLHLVVTNPEQLMHGCRPQHVFEQAGGSVGSESATWLLRDSASTIAPRHFEITVRDGHFCITDASGKTHLNGDPQPMGAGRIARVGEGDRIGIGPYQLAVSLNAATAAAFVDSESHGDILDVVPAKQGYAEHTQLDRMPGSAAMLDRTHYGQSLRAETYGDGAGTTGEAMVFKPTPAESRITADALAAVEDGLGVAFGPLDAATAHTLLREIGQTVRAAVEGIIEVHTVAPRNGSPIEDNPLRLGLNVAATIQALFGPRRSPFHLAPAAAMRDSLTQMERQQQAAQGAIDGGVAALLDALAPQALAQRFERYAPANAPRNGEWLWLMYEAYYREVMAPHAQGAQRLFRDAFADAYDRALRSTQDRQA